MKTQKKSSPKTWALILTTLILVLAALFTQPTLKTNFKFIRNRQLTKLFQDLTKNKLNQAQTLWQFREFYTRGVIHLAKFETLNTPKELKDLVEFPASFSPQLSFTSKRSLSVEGFIDSQASYQLKTKLRQVLETNETQVFEVNQNQYLIIATFSLDQAAQANGYLYFDLRNPEFVQKHQQQKWLVVTLVTK